MLPDPVAWPLVERRGLAQLLGHPGVGGVPRDADVDDPTRAQRDHDEGEERAKEGVRDRQEVAGPDVTRMIAQEGRPRLSRASRRSGIAHVFLHGPLGHADVRLQQLAADALRAPLGIGGGHLPDQGDRLGRDLRAARAPRSP